MKGSLLVVFCMLAKFAPAINAIEIALNVEEASHIEINDCRDVWGWYDGANERYYSLLCSPGSLIIIDATVPNCPEIVTEVFHGVSDVIDVKVSGDYAYVASRRDYGEIWICHLPEVIQSEIYIPGDDHILYLDDSGNRPGSIPLGYIESIYADENYLIVNELNRSGSGGNEIALLSLDNPETPRLLDHIWNQDDFNTDIDYFEPHSAYIRGTTAYLFVWKGGIYQVDFDGDNGNILNWEKIWYHSERGDVKNNYPFGDYECDPWPDPPLTKRPYTHSGWLTENGNYLLVSDEHPGGREDCQAKFAPLLRIFKVSDFGVPEAAPINAFDILWNTTTEADEHYIGCEVIDDYSSKTLCPYGECEMATDYPNGLHPLPPWPLPNFFHLGMHNVHVKDHLAFMSWWSRGLQILDITDINNITYTGCLDHGTGLEGDWTPEAWGVYPYSPDGYIYVSGVEGLYICRYGYTGELTEDAAWRGDVYVYETLTVPDDLTLTIQPGTDVHMFAGASIVVDGTLTAEGTSSDSIRFFALGGNPQPGDWEGIYFSQYSGGSLAYCSIRDAVNGIEMDDYAEVTVEHSLIKGCSVAGIDCYKGYLTVDHSRIDNNGEYGINSYIAENTITNSQLYNNGEYGIKVNGTYGSSNILDNIIDCNGQFTQAGIEILNADDILIEGTEINNYENSVIFYNSDAEITDCELTFNEIAVYSQQYSRPTIRWCVTSDSHIGIKTCTHGSADAGRVSDWGWCSFGLPSPVNQGYYIYHVPGQGQMSPDTLWAQNNYYGISSPDRNKFYAGAPNVIMWQPCLDGAPPPKRDPGNNRQLPLEFSVAQNYPNPFNPQTEIRFTLDEPSFTTVAIYNLLGQRVASLLSAEIGTGEHEVAWNGKDERGNPATSGIYFYVIQAGERLETKKMTLLR